MLHEPAWSVLCFLASDQHGVFTRQQAATLGVSRGMLDRLVQRGTITRLHRGVLSFAGAPPTWRSRLMAATLAGGGSHASHRAAACLHGLDGFTGPQPVEVTVPRGRNPVGADIVVHRWTGPEANDYTRVDSIATSGIATTLARLGAVVPALQVERALDDALRQGHSLRWIRETAERLHRPGPAGTGVLLKLLRDPARRQPVAGSYFERLTARLLSEAGLPAPALQHPVRLENGRSVRIDIAWPQLRWGIECHSRRYHFGAARVAADHDRDHLLATAGWQIAYLTWHQMQDSDYVVELARNMLALRQAPPSA